MKSFAYKVLIIFLLLNEFLSVPKKNDNLRKLQTQETKKLEERIIDFISHFKKIADQRGMTVYEVIKESLNLTSGVKEVSDYMVTNGLSFEEALVKWLKEYIPQKVEDDTMLFVFDLLSYIFTVSKSVRDSNYENNVKVWNQKKIGYMSSDGYIQYQERMTDLKYGEESKYLNKYVLSGRTLDASENSCEVIAIYNTMKYLNNGQEKETFPNLLKRFETKGISLYGYFGTAPYELQTYLNAKGYNTKIFTGNKMKDLNTSLNGYNAFVFTFYNSHIDIFKGVHTICVTKDGSNKYITYNSNNAFHYDSIDSLVEGFNKDGKKPISIIGVKN